MTPVTEIAAPLLSKVMLLVPLLLSIAVTAFKVKVPEEADFRVAPPVPPTVKVRLKVSPAVVDIKVAAVVEPRLIAEVALPKELRPPVTSNKGALTVPELIVVKPV